MKSTTLADMAATAIRSLLQWEGIAFDDTKSRALVAHCRDENNPSADSFLQAMSRYARGPEQRVKAAADIKRYASRGRKAS